MLPEWCQQQMRASGSLDAIANYLVIIFDDGDWLNDYAADIPECGRHLILSAGQLIALAIGG
jgi:hypothetical protein